MAKYLVMLENNKQYIYNGFTINEIIEDLNRNNITSIAFIVEPNGYVIVKNAECGAFEVVKDDESDIFETDEQAVEQAIKDGVKIIPENELAKFPKHELGWVDTVKNRETIRFYTEDFYLNFYSMI